MNIKNINPEKIKQIKRKPWLSRNDIYQIYPVGHVRSLEMFNQAKEKAILENYYLPICRPPVVPTECVIDLFPIGH